MRTAQVTRRPLHKPPGTPPLLVGIAAGKAPDGDSVNVAVLDAGVVLVGLDIDRLSLLLAKHPNPHVSPDNKHRLIKGYRSAFGGVLDSASCRRQVDPITPRIPPSPSAMLTARALPKWKFDQGFEAPKLKLHLLGSIHRVLASIFIHRLPPCPVRIEPHRLDHAHRGPQPEQEPLVALLILAPPRAPITRPPHKAVAHIHTPRSQLHRDVRSELQNLRHALGHMDHIPGTL
mmetsp:Transcript_42935/g.107444  ORF Transcript_42935/g.107444 Transcript_42935/m.107444 type:complete len:232 (+) Transcript_42935:393-1088(+)